MKRQVLWILGTVCVFLSILLFMTQSSAYEEATKSDKFFISGTIMDSHKEPVKDVHIKVLVNDQSQKIMVKHKWVEETEISSHGNYQIEFRLQPGQINTASVQLEITKPNYCKTKVELKKDGPSFLYIPFHNSRCSRGDRASCIDSRLGITFV
jgi:hypothetical protein